MNDPAYPPLSPASPAVCIAEAAKEAIDMALEYPDERDAQLLRAIQQITYLRGH
jgi:protein-disulfide isomerase-like protein with CxxC motif